jgi:uracil phosphoribosyltransferase
MRMRQLVSDHPLVAQKVTRLRDINTGSAEFRALTTELVTLLAYEATRDISVEEVPVTTPVTTTTGVGFTQPVPLIVPILRAGLGMLDGMLALLPSAEVGFLGMVRDEETLEARTYAERLPADLTGRHCYVLDPMLATGGSLAQAMHFLFERGAAGVTAVCLLAAPEGVAHVEQETAGKDVHLVIASLDEKLNEVGYIVPGLGDAGDRLYGQAS